MDEVIRKINEAEQKSQQIIDAAKADAVKTADAAKVKCAEILSSAEQSAGISAAKIIEDATKNADGVYSHIFESYSDKCSEIEKKAGAAVESAADALIKAII